MTASLGDRICMTDHILHHPHADDRSPAHWASLCQGHVMYVWAVCACWVHATHCVYGALSSRTWQSGNQSINLIHAWSHVTTHPWVNLWTNCLCDSHCSIFYVGQKSLVFALMPHNPLLYPSLFLIFYELLVLMELTRMSLDWEKIWTTCASDHCYGPEGDWPLK